MNKIDFLEELRNMLAKEYPDARKIEITLEDGRIDMRITENWEGETWSVG